MRISKPFSRDSAGQAGEVAYFHCYIAGEPWRYAMVTLDQMQKLADDMPNQEPVALCVSDTSSIFFLKGRVTHTTAIHEIVHAYFAETLTHSADLTADQTEEILCDIMAFNWCRIVLLARVMVHNMLCYELWLNGDKDQDWILPTADMIDGRVAENLCELVATYITSCGYNALLKAATPKKRKRRKPSPKGR